MIKILFLLVVLLVLTGCFNVLDSSDPVAVAESAVNAIGSRDTVEVAKHFTPTPGAMMSARLERQYALTDDCRVENVRAWLRYQTDVDARVQVEWDMVWIVNGVEDTDHQKVEMQLIKNKNKWYVNEAWSI